MAPNLPKTFKAALFKEANAPLTLEDVELRQPGEGQILIKVLATGVCHSDAGVQAGAMNSLYLIPQHSLPFDNLEPDSDLLVPGFQATNQSEMSLPWVLARRSGRSAIAWEPLGMEGTMVSCCVPNHT